MRAKVLGRALLAGLLALTAGAPMAHSAILTTAPEIEGFSLDLGTGSFLVSRDGQNAPVVSNNSPIVDFSLLTFDQFNGPGELLGVTISFLTEFRTIARVGTPENGEDQTISFINSVSVNRSIANTQLIDPQTSSQFFNVTCSAAGGDGCSNTSSTSGSFVTPGGGVGLVSGALALFIGNATFDLNATLRGVLTPFTNPDNGTDFIEDTSFNGTLTSIWRGNVTVFYTYRTDDASVPLPWSLYLVVAGLGGVALARWYRR